VIVSSGDDAFLESHRREISVVFCDLLGFTPFTESTEPEDMIRVLRTYHEAMGEEAFRFGGTVGRFAGDGLMIFFNDPLPCPDPAVRAIRMAVAMRGRMDTLLAGWGKLGYALGFGVGIALGHATLARLGFQSRFEYEPNGRVVNLAARLCDQAASGQILIDQRVCAAVEELAQIEHVGDLLLKGFGRPMPTYNIVGLKQQAAMDNFEASSPFLTSREREVARLLAAGRTNREVADILVITEGTVEVHVKHILSKLGLRSRAQVAAWAMDQSL
jgi:class 3 adenylate cyclase/DNA-binding CsgD family transcriptional regulator